MTVLRKYGWVIVPLAVLVFGVVQALSPNAHDHGGGGAMHMAMPEM